MKSSRIGFELVEFEDDLVFIATLGVNDPRSPAEFRKGFSFPKLGKVERQNSSEKLEEIKNPKPKEVRIGVHKNYDLIGYQMTLFSLLYAIERILINNRSPFDEIMNYLQDPVYYPLDEIWFARELRTPRVERGFLDIRISFTISGEVVITFCEKSKRKLVPLKFPSIKKFCSKPGVEKNTFVLFSDFQKVLFIGWIQNSPDHSPLSLTEWMTNRRIYCFDTYRK